MHNWHMCSGYRLGLALSLAHTCTHCPYRIRNCVDRFCELMPRLRQSASVSTARVCRTACLSVLPVRSKSRLNFCDTLRSTILCRTWSSFTSSFLRWRPTSSVRASWGRKRLDSTVLSIALSPIFWVNPPLSWWSRSRVLRQDRAALWDRGLGLDGRSKLRVRF